MCRLESADRARVVHSFQRSGGGPAHDDRSVLHGCDQRFNRASVADHSKRMRRGLTHVAVLVLQSRA
jgi:hypothetical protein